MVYLPRDRYLMFLSDLDRMKYLLLGNWSETSSRHLQYTIWCPNIQPPRSRESFEGCEGPKEERRSQTFWRRSSSQIFESCRNQKLIRMFFSRLSWSNEVAWYQVSYLERCRSQCDDYRSSNHARYDRRQACFTGEIQNGRKWDTEHISKGVQDVLDKYNLKAEELKTEYQKGLEKRDDFREFGWILTDHCTDGYDGKQHTIATYI